MRSFLFPLAILPPLTAAASYCPFLGPVFPAPTSLATNAPFNASFETLRTTLANAIANGTSPQGPVSPNDTYSIQVFSINDEAPLFDFHHRGVGLVGNDTLNGESIYRIASTTKLITVYMLLIAGGDGVMSDVVTRYLPELAGKGYYDEMTVGSLAGYLGGVIAEGYSVDGLAGGGLKPAFPDAFPDLSPGEIPPCAYGQTGCTREIFLKHIATRRPVHLPNTTPGYTNAAFALLGLILESLTGKSYDDNIRDLLSMPLGLKGTTASAPRNASNGVIVVDESTVGWDLVLDGAGTGMGAMFSSANDMARIGRAILASSLLQANTTRAWMKPVSHTSALTSAVGLGWEIYRATVGPPEHNRVIDLYSKSGNVGGYGANFVLIPGHGVGFVILSAGLRGRTPDAISNIMADHLLPALDEVARVEANERFAGTYTASDGLNSTLVLSTAPGVPGMSVETWISNSTDVLRNVYGVGAVTENYQMYPTNVESDGGARSSWRATYISTGMGSGPFSPCLSWVALDRPTYGMYGVDEFEFHVGEDGVAIAVEPKAFKVVLERR